MYDVVSLTINPCLDVGASVPRVVPEDKLRCDAPHYDPGGGGINVACVVQALGGRSLAIWARGSVIGQFLGQLLDAHRLDHRPVDIAGLTRQNLIVFEKATRLQYRFGMPGSPLSRDEQRDCGQMVGTLASECRVIVLSGSIPPEVPVNFYRRIIERLPTGSMVIVDTSGAALRESVGPGLFLIKPNRRELSQLTGCRGDDEAGLADAALGLVRDGAAQVVAVSIGSGGVIYATVEGARTIRCPDVPILSKVGAGDSMVGGIAAMLARDKSVEEAMRYGVAAGTATVMTDGTGLARRDDVERLYAEIGAIAERQAS